MKEAGYVIFAFLYRIFKFFPMKKNSAFLIMTHDGGPEGNVAVTASYMKRFYHTQTTELLRKDTDFRGKGGLKRTFSFFFSKAFAMARAEYILMDNAFLPMAYMKVRKETRVIQLWHGTGTIKKFGQDVNTGKLYELEKRANSNISYVIVNSEATRELYAGCFSVPVERVKVLGLPRTDLLFSGKELLRRRGLFFKQYPDLMNKKLILYAPTFRDSEVDEPKLHLDLEMLVKELPKEYCLGLRLHPFVAERFHLEKEYEGKIIDFSSYYNLNTLLMATDLLITDYSSIIFEYCVFRRPMIFFAYDLEEFSDHGRGFYRDYEEYVPGPVVKTTKEILTVIQEKDWRSEKLQEFFKDSYAYADGKSAKRVVEFMMKDTQ
ncbi:MAG: CDP-glycerol glycerophosphotransferase family protein [Lachnospiraceae bacterium]|nr:CDP-glycerol glycerophosphotransferase family protein [Lachnospiraceae bacterium]